LPLVQGKRRIARFSRGRARRSISSGPWIGFDARSLDAIDFSMLADETPFDYWIDDVSFIPW